MKSESECEDGCYDADGEGTIDGGPPAAMNARVADQDEKTEANDKLGNSGPVERSGIRKDRHSCWGVRVKGRQG